MEFSLQVGGIAGGMRSLTLVLALGSVLFLDYRMGRAGLRPRSFATPWGARRIAAGLLVGFVLWLGIFLPLTGVGQPPADLSGVPKVQLFLLHAVFLSTMVGWYLLAYAFPGAATGPAVVHDSDGKSPERFSRQFGLVSTNPLREIGIGLAAGLGAWVCVLVILILIGALIWALGGEDALPQDPPAMVPWIAGLPLGLRLALSASAGFAEELFFRGFLQPRTGIAFSTALFALAHVGYGQPLMLVGVTILSLIFAGLVRWRQNVWAAVVAHTAFDVLQLTVVIPKALEIIDGASDLTL